MKKHDNMNDKVIEWLTLLSCASGGSSQAWSKCLVWSAQSAMCRNTSESSPAALSLCTRLTQMCQEHNTNKKISRFLHLQLAWFMHVYLPFSGTPRKSLLEMSTTVQRSKLRTSTWSKLCRSSRWVCVEETLTSTVCCKPGPVRADTEKKFEISQISLNNRSLLSLQGWLKGKMLPLVKYVRIFFHRVTLLLNMMPLSFMPTQLSPCLLPKREV